MKKRIVFLSLFAFVGSLGVFADTGTRKPYIDFGNTAWLIAAAVGGASRVFYGNGHQILSQLVDLGATVVWSGLGTLVTFNIADWLVGVRVTERQEGMGLDLSRHNEKAYTVIEQRSAA